MDKHFLKTIKLVADFLVCDDYDFIQNKQSNCDKLCIDKSSVTFGYDSEFIVFKNCKNIQNRKSIKYIYDILKLYIKTFKFYSRECINPITSHELKGILSTAMLSLEMLEKYDFGIEDRNKLTKQAFESVSKSVKVFEEMLHIEKLNHQNETKTLKIENVNMIELINKNIKSLTTSIQIKKIKLEIEDKTNGQAVLNGDYFWLDRAIFNLINNAIEHNIMNGFINLTLVWEKNILKIVITNSCLDVKNHDKQKLFDKFQTFDDAQHTGTGIGLSLVKTVAKTHGAFINFESKTSGQMTFNFELSRQIKSKRTINNLSTVAAAFIAFMLGASYFFPIIPTFDNISKKGEFDIIEIEDGSTIRVKNSSNYNFWHFRNLTNSKSYKRLHIDNGYVEADIKGNPVYFIASSAKPSNKATKVVFDKSNNKSSLSVLEGSVESRDKEIQSGHGYNEGKVATLLSPPSDIKLDNLNNGKIKITTKVVKNAKKYRFIIAKDEQFKNIICFYSSNKPEIITSVNQDDCYYTKIVAIDKNDIAGYPNVIKFKNTQMLSQAKTTTEKDF
ncbi:MAG: HAMP domain-containing sensor histidine kinase [Sulfurovaceae bacterium]|nr:HAMP domain-containing sensor histidine kinase [Sulfurovaceae bacterium]